MDIISLICAIIFLFLAIYITVARPDWVLSRYNKMNELERQQSNITPEKIFRVTIITCWVMGGLSLVFFVLNSYILV